MLTLKAESLSSKAEIREAFSYETFINLPHNCFFPVEEFYLRLSTTGFWALIDLLSSSNFNTFSRSCLIYFLSTSFSYSCLEFGLMISPIVRLKMLLAWIIFLSIKLDRSNFLLLYLFYCKTGFLIELPFADSVLANSLTKPWTPWSCITCCSLCFFFYWVFSMVWVTVFSWASSLADD